MRKLYLVILVFILGACSAGDLENLEDDTISIGLVVTDSGLGDESYSDSALRGLENARDELGIIFDYREPFDTDYEEQVKDLIKDDHDLIVGLGYEMEEAINKLADTYPDQNFAIIDTVSDKSNVTSITFKVEDGSYLVGLIAGLKTKTNTVSFIGGEKAPAIEVFETGFRKGVLAANKDAKVITDYADTFGDDAVGAKIAKEQIDKGSDFIFPAAGFTGIGALHEAQNNGVYAFGVDSDQFFVAEKAVVTSMLKNIDIALFNLVEELASGKELNGEHLELGIAEEGVGLAPIRIIQLSDKEQATFDQLKTKGE